MAGIWPPWLGTLGVMVVASACAAGLLWALAPEEGEGADVSRDRPAPGLLSRSPAPAVGDMRVPALPAASVLRQWDTARARAFARADPRALAALYLGRSAAGEADVALLRDYRRRGLRVDDLRMQVLDLDVLHHEPGRYQLRVTDRVHTAFAVGRAGHRVQMPRDQATTRRLTLHRTGPAHWQVVAVSRPRQPPAAH